MTEKAGNAGIGSDGEGSLRSLANKRTGGRLGRRDLQTLLHGVEVTSPPEEEALGEEEARRLRLLRAIALIRVVSGAQRLRRRTRAEVVAEREGLLTVDEAGKYLGISKRQVYRLSSVKLSTPPQLASVTLGRCRRWKRSDLDNYVAERRRRQVPAYLLDPG